MSPNAPVPLFPRHTFDSAPAGAKPSLQKIKEAVGAVPNLAAAMAESPQLIEAFASIRAIHQSGTFTAAEREVLSLVNAVENGCRYCRAIHSMFAAKAGLAPEEMRRLRAGESPGDPRLGALADFGRAVVRQRGHLPPEAFAAFFRAGYSKAQALEVLVALATSVIANYAGHFTQPELDEPLRAHA